MLEGQDTTSNTHNQSKTKYVVSLYHNILLLK